MKPGQLLARPKVGRDPIVHITTTQSRERTVCGRTFIAFEWIIGLPRDHGRRTCKSCLRMCDSTTM